MAENKTKLNKTEHSEPELTSRQERAIVALISSPTIEGAAKAAKIGRVTLFKYLQEPLFQKVYREAKRQSVEHAIAKLQRVSTKAVDILEEIMRNRDAPASARVTAAKTVLEMAVKAIEFETLEERIAALEDTYIRGKGTIRNDW